MQMINFGCGLSIHTGWKNFDASPTLRLQRLPVLGPVAELLIKPRFPCEATYGDVVRGLPVATATVDRIYCSHVLEHLSLADIRTALAEVMRVLKPGGIFRGVLPDLENDVRHYIADPSEHACSRFMEYTSLGISMRPSGIVPLVRSFLGNSRHLWMWDYKGLSAELSKVGFVNIRRAEFGDSSYKEFNAVEDPARWEGCLGFECSKPM